jgi:hypothetical protein
MTRNLFILLTCAVLLGGSVFGHGNFQHVMGTVTKVSPDSVSVETTAQTTVDVQIVSETTLTKDNAPASLKDVHTGDRVVIHAMPMLGGKLMAHPVQIGVSKTSPSSH